MKRDTKYLILRKTSAILLGSIWAYRANMAITIGVTARDMWIFLFLVFATLSLLISFTYKQLGDWEKAKEEAQKDANWAIIALVVAFIVKYLLDKLF